MLKWFASKDYRRHKTCHSYSYEWGKDATLNMAAPLNEAPPSEQKSQSLIGKVSASLQLAEVPVDIETVSALRHVPRTVHEHWWF